MTLTYENETSTIEGFAESAQSEWIAAVSDRCEATRGVSLASLDGMPISSRFCSWIGRSGRRYVFSVYPALECPTFHDAVLLAVIRDMTGRRRVVSVRDTGGLPEPAVATAQRELRAFGPGLEFHLHLLATSAAERAATLADLAGAEV